MRRTRQSGNTTTRPSSTTRRSDCARTPVEYALTLRYLERYIEPGAIVAEVGVGGGLYSEFLAKHGCWLHLIDVAQRLLEVARERLRAANLDERILDVRCASATGISHIVTGGCDAVLLLGPLYHLRSLEDRQRALAEAARVLKTGGLLYAAGINRLAFLRDAFRARPDYTSERRSFHLEFLRDGNLDPQHCASTWLRAPDYQHRTPVPLCRCLHGDYLCGG